MEYNTSSSSEKTEKIYRSYSLSSEEDFKNIENGRCPSYALHWGLEYNKSYWKPGHDFIEGNKSTTENLEYLLMRKWIKIEKKPKIYCTLECLLVDVNNNNNYTTEESCLWNILQNFDPMIITNTTTMSRQIEKRNECNKYLGENIQMFFCGSKEKPYYCDEPKAILIDKDIIVEKSWEEAGGIFIHHQNNQKTLEELLDILE
jgi:hypothetical protein